MFVFTHSNTDRATTAGDQPTDKRCSFAGSHRGVECVLELRSIVIVKIYERAVLCYYCKLVLVTALGLFSIARESSRTESTVSCIPIKKANHFIFTPIQVGRES